MRYRHKYNEIEGDNWLAETILSEAAYTYQSAFFLKKIDTC